MTRRVIALVPGSLAIAGAYALAACQQQPTEQTEAGKVVDRLVELERQRAEVCEDLTEQEKLLIGDDCEIIKERITRRRRQICEANPISPFDKASKAMSCAVEGD